jgi:hydrogenase maturation protein HypF
LVENLKEPAVRAVGIRVRGVVQGVGFRPFVYRLALSHGLRGWVCNTSGDVRIEVEGDAGAIDRFLSGLRSDPPPLSRIEEIHSEEIEPRGHGPFEIRESLSEEGRFQRMSPDIATCRDCREELFDPRDRRYRYPFINCTHCGPRLTIIKDIPYDRPKTTMAAFRMCADCRREYEDPLDRRFHAQPNCCPKCGPSLAMVDREGRDTGGGDPVFDAAGRLRRGEIIGLKGIGGFLLACDATKDGVVEELRRRKKRPSKPFAVMLAGLEEARELCALSRAEEELLASPRSPIVLLGLRKEGLVSRTVAPGLKDLGVMLPYTPLHHLLMRAVAGPLVMTSGNLSEEPIIAEDKEALDKLSSIADGFLVHDRPIYAPCDDSVVLIEDAKPRVIRRARGYAPDPLILDFDASEVLACGAEMKSTFCVTKGRYAFLSQHVGDMENLETQERFELLLDLYRRMYRLEPRIVAHDLHPDYLSTRLAMELKEKDEGLALVPVQHHHAHVASCVAENHLELPVLGIAFDGTGYGPDQTIWGGEFLLLRKMDKADRVGHLQRVPLPGGDAAIRKPYRMAISYLTSLLGEEILQRVPRLREGKAEKELSFLIRQIKTRTHSPLTSSAGRLFDAVAAVIGVRERVDYEGQAAMELETVCSKAPARGEAYPFRIEERDGTWVPLLGELFLAIVDDLSGGVAAPTISARFHLTVALMIARTAGLIARSTGVRQVALSGGTFQNRLLVGLTRTLLEEEGFQVATHHEIPCNDGGLSLGQAVVAHFAARR